MTIDSKKVSDILLTEKNPLVRASRKIVWKLMAPFFALLEERIDRYGENIRANNHRIEILNENVLGDYGSIDYAGFESHFRGSEEEIRKRQEEYIPYFKSCGKVLDIGCGRGEFLDLLKDNYIAAAGVDLYEPYVRQCQKRGLDVMCQDCIEYLEASEKVDGIFAAQLVEHLTYTKIIQLLQKSYKKLNDGGVLIIETPNPMSLYIFSHAFYIDPTHKRPVHPMTLQYLARVIGFESADILYTEGSKPLKSVPPMFLDETQENPEYRELIGRTMDIIYGSQDYALVARKKGERNGH